MVTFQHIYLMMSRAGLNTTCSAARFILLQKPTPRNCTARAPAVEIFIWFHCISYQFILTHGCDSAAPSKGYYRLRRRCCSVRNRQGVNSLEPQVHIQYSDITLCHLSPHSIRTPAGQPATWQLLSQPQPQGQAPQQTPPSWAEMGYSV